MWGRGIFKINLIIWQTWWSCAPCTPVKTNNKETKRERERQREGERVRARAPACSIATRQPMSLDFSIIVAVEICIWGRWRLDKSWDQGLVQSCRSYIFAQGCCCCLLLDGQPWMGCIVCGLWAEEEVVWKKMPWRFCLLLQLSWGTTAIASQLEAVERGLNNKPAEGEGDAESSVSEKV